MSEQQQDRASALNAFADLIELAPAPFYPADKVLRQLYDPERDDAFWLIYHGVGSNDLNAALTFARTALPGAFGTIQYGETGVTPREVCVNGPTTSGVSRGANTEAMGVVAATLRALADCAT